ncbi:protein prune homolog 2-like [Clavelina lepadiformis]|uniref:protein prune homolog 2-like n=1 Tax=Clavelina lepadiformis TaxID=159417 RepID=UPI004043253B
MDKATDDSAFVENGESFADSNTSGDITFEDQWEEDDLVALSGQPGRSFQRIQTQEDPEFFNKAATTRRKLPVDLSNENARVSEGDLSESDLDGIATPEELLTPSDMPSSVPSSPQCNSGVDLEWDNDTPVIQPSTEEPVTINHNPSIWKTVVIGEQNYKLDLSAVSPYRQVLSHGGYYGEGLNAIVVFSACYLPSAEQTEYQYIMDNLFLYIVSTLELLVAEDYMIIFFNGGCHRKNFPALKWLKKCYQMIHRRLRKNLKQLVVVHPSWYIRLFLGFFRPFISSKFSRKLKLVSSLHKLADLVPLDNVVVPDAVQHHDIKLQAISNRNNHSQPNMNKFDGKNTCGHLEQQSNGSNGESSSLK